MPLGFPLVANVCLLDFCVEAEFGQGRVDQLARRPVVRTPVKVQEFDLHGLVLCSGSAM